MSNFLEIALSHAARGWHVHPLKPGDKIPITAHGKNDATKDEEQIRAWWAQVPSANVGISCEPSGLCVLDADHGLKDEADFLAWRDRNGLPVTYAVRSGRRPEFGVQSYYTGPVKDGRFELDGVTGDIKSLGGLVLAAGCIHPDSKEAYYVLVDTPLADTPPVIEQSRKRLPAEKPGEPIRKLHIGEGRRPLLMTKLGSLFNTGMSRDALLAAMVDLNQVHCADLVDFEILEKMVDGNLSKWTLPPPAPQVVIGKTAAPPEPAPLPERNRPTYPVEVWDGTAAGEFAKLCAHDNNVPRKCYVESFRCALGAVVGDRISSPGVEGALPRSYTIIIAPKGKGKGTAIRRAVRFFNQSWYATATTAGLLSGERDFIWKPQGIGAWMAAASSVPGMAKLAKDLEKTLKNSPHLTWGNTLPRILSVHEEFKTFLSTLFIEGGVGSGMEGVVCQLWDDVSFNGTATHGREPAYGEMLFSLLAGVTEQDWFDLLSRGNAVGGGLMSRFNLIGTEGGYLNVSKMQPPDFTGLQETFLPRVRLLADAACKIPPTEAADHIISEWADNLPEGSERMNIHAWRGALSLAWLRREETISAQTAEDAVRLGQYQVDSHDYYRAQAADTPVAKVQARIVRVLQMSGELSKRELQKRTNAHRDGTELWNRALDGLVKERSVGRREDGSLYWAA